jgi:hypothetical protein
VHATMPAADLSGGWVASGLTKTPSAHTTLNTTAIDLSFLAHQEPDDLICAPSSIPYQLALGQQQQQLSSCHGCLRL